MRSVLISGLLLLGFALLQNPIWIGAATLGAHTR